MKQYLKQNSPTSITFDGPQLESKQWAKVKRSVENIEGKWNSSTQSWDFPFDVTRLFKVIQSEEFKLSSKFQFFETPEWLIQGYMSYRYQCMDRDAYVHDFKVLEPSAGRGKILKFLHQWGLNPDFCEFMPENRAILEGMGYTKIVGEDFLKLDRPDYYDLVFANPPFNKDKQHIKKMFEVAKPGGAIVTLGSYNLFDDNDFTAWILGHSSYTDIVTIADNEEDATFNIGEQIFKGTKVGCSLLVARKL